MKKALIALLAITSVAHGASKHKIEIYKTDLDYEKSKYTELSYLYPEVRLKALTRPDKKDYIARPAITLTVLMQMHSNGDLRTLKFYYKWENERWQIQDEDYSPAIESEASPMCNLYKLVSSDIENKRPNESRGYPRDYSMSFNKKPHTLACATRVWLNGEKVLEKIDKSRNRPLPNGWQKMIAE